MSREDKMDIYFKIKNIIDKYISNVSVYDIKKYFKHNSNFNGLLDDIKWYGIQLVKDSEEYKSLVREILNDIIDNYIAEKEDKINENNNDLEYYKNAEISFYISFIKRHKGYEFQLHLSDDYDNDGPFYKYIISNLYNFINKNFNITDYNYINNIYLNIYVDYLTTINIINYFYNLDCKKILKTNELSFLVGSRNTFSIDISDVIISDLIPYKFYNSELELIDNEIHKNGVNDFLIKLILLTNDNDVKEKYNYLINANKFDLI
jgi:hypothetical protein